MKRVGTKWICDRCNKEEFAERVESTLPNGINVDATPMPEGWGRTFDPEDNELCKSCYERWERMRAEFFGKKK